MQNAELWSFLQKQFKLWAESPYHHFEFCILHFAFWNLKCAYAHFKFQFIFLFCLLDIALK